MSRYLVNKLMHEVTVDDSLRLAFRADPAATVSEWENRQVQPFDDDERTAVVAVDYTQLYTMGVHPFLLWVWVSGVLADESMTIRELSRRYREAVAPYGTPDYST